MTHDSCESKSRSVLQLIGTYTTLIAVILVSCIIVSECFVVICRIPAPPPDIIVDGYYIVLGGYIVLGEYIVLGVINIICVGVLFYKSVPEIKKLKSGNETALSEVTILFVILLFLTGIVTRFFKPDLPNFLAGEESRDWELELSVLSAPVLEEILFRVLCIGVPVLFIALITKKRGACPPLRKYLAGGFEINKLVLFLIFLSSFIFGVAHIEGWGVWKFYIMFIVGLMLGYLFVKYGLYASISAHFLLNYLSVEVLLLGSGGVVLELLLSIMAIVCIPSIYFYVKKRGQYFSKTLLKGKSN